METLTLSSICPSELPWKQSAPLLMKVYSQKCHFCCFPRKSTLYVTSCVLLHICHFLAQDLWLIIHYWLFEVTVAPGRITSELPTGQFLNFSNSKDQAVMFNFETSVENWRGQTWTNKFEWAGHKTHWKLSWEERRGNLTPQNQERSLVFLWQLQAVTSWG